MIGAAFFLDFGLGDPVFAAHPVRLMGLAVNRLEAFFRALPLGTVATGFLFAVSLIAGVWAVAALVLAGLTGIAPFLGGLAQVVLLYFCLSARDLEKSARAIYQLLIRKDMTAARQNLSLIVGRETAALDEEGIVRATVETVAENLVDGVLSPLFFALLGGAPLALAYKMVNTLDSMVGYKNERYEQFGKAAARIDDAANFIPARLSLLLISPVAAVLFRSGGRTFGTAIREGRRHTSPNAGYPEAAFAGALFLKLGGPNHYYGRRVDKPYIGEQYGPARPEHISKSCRLMLGSAVMGTGLACLLAALF